MFANIPEVKLGIIAVSRGCFPMALSERRRAAIKAAYGEGLYECPVTVENELDARRAVEDVQAAGVNALVVFLGNFGPETPETLIAEWFSGPIMYAAAAEGDGDLHDGRGDAYCGMEKTFDALLAQEGMPYRLADILPRVLCAGAAAGTLTAEGACLLDPTGVLRPGVPLCPPEGDAGTGMAATNSVGVRTGNVSAGTSVFAMAVLERPLARVYPEIDMVTTPTGRPVAMVHCNTCTSDLDAWVRVLGEMAGAAGAKLEKPRLYDLFYQKALEGEADCGGLVSYNYYSGEPVTGVESGRPLFMRRPDARFTLANFARVQLYAAMATLKLGMDILVVEEGVRLDTLLGHGGLFKTPVAGQKLLAGALGVPVAVMETAGEGGPWGMALLAAYCVRRAEGQTLEEYLADTVFRGAQGSVQQPDAADTAGFARFLTDYKSGLTVEKAAAAALR